MQAISWHKPYVNLGGVVSGNSLHDVSRLFFKLFVYIIQLKAKLMFVCVCVCGGGGVGGLGDFSTAKI